MLHTQLIFLEDSDKILIFFSQGLEHRLYQHTLHRRAGGAKEVIASRLNPASARSLTIARYLWGCICIWKSEWNMFLSFCDSTEKGLCSIQQNVHPSYSVKLRYCFSVIQLSVMRPISSSDRNRTNVVTVIGTYTRISFRWAIRLRGFSKDLRGGKI